MAQPATSSEVPALILQLLKYTLAVGFLNTFSTLWAAAVNGGGMVLPLSSRKDGSPPLVACKAFVE